jgi:hypothetical protein
MREERREKDPWKGEQDAAQMQAAAEERESK